MIEFFEIFLFLTSVSLFSLVFWKDKSGIFLFRSIGLIFSILILFSFYINWLLEMPLSLNLSSLVFLSLALITIIIKSKDARELKKYFRFSKSGWIFILISFSFSLIASLNYFQWDIQTPFYTSPDSGGHYLYMSRTAESGFMPLFSPNEIYEASGNNPVFEHHHDTHFPGSSIAFFILDKVFFFLSKLELLQVFNILLYFLVSTYLFLISKKYLKDWFLASIFFIIIFLGTIFTIMMASYTNQLFGLFILIFFIDIFSAYYKEGLSFLAPLAGLSALVISYIFWLPVAIIFIFLTIFPDLIKISKIDSSRKIAYVFLICFGAVVISAKYLSVSLNNQLIGYSTTGLIKFPGLFWGNVLIIFPFFAINAYLLIKEKLANKKNDLCIDFSFAAILYSLILLVFFYLEKVSGYPIFKSFHLAIPAIWLIGLGFFGRKFQRKIELESIREISKKYKFAILFAFIILLLVQTSTIRIMVWGKSGGYSNFFPLITENIENIVTIGKLEVSKSSPGITQDQVAFLNKLKSDYSWAIKDGRLLIAAIPRTSLWIFSFSDIWPRTTSLLEEGRKNDGIFAPMSFYSRGIFNYSHWLLNDEEHILAIFEDSYIKKWIYSNNFDYDDYETIFSVGDNHLLKLKENAKVIYSYQRLPFDDYESIQLSNDKEEVFIVERFREEFTAKDNLAGLSIIISAEDNFNREYLFELRESDCEKGRIILNKKITSDNIKSGFFNDFSFETISNSKGKTYCYSILPENNSLEEKESPLNLWRYTSTGEIVLDEIYEFSPTSS